MKKRIALIADYDPKSTTHAATVKALQHSAQHLGESIDCKWVYTEDISNDLFKRFHGIWVGTGSPYKNMQKVLWAIQYARENSVPTLGTCGGFQHLLLEIAINVLGIEDAAHAEYNPNASKLFISQLACSLAGREMSIQIMPESQVGNLYQSQVAREEYYCNFGVNPDYIEKLRSSPIKIVGSDQDGEVRIIELPDHPFFIGTLFVPQIKSTPEQPHPLINGFVKVIMNG